VNDDLSRLSASLADRYRIERELGAGGMATVYLAHDLKHDRNVAIKVLRPELAAVIGADRFLSEIKTTANLQHPHILSLFDSGTVDGTVFYVMPFVDGESLRDRLTREKQLPLRDALAIAREIADALQYAHSHGVIHRDIKPENILLQGGHALVADFGIALAASKVGGNRMTETGMSLGTPQYMSPEQAMGERELDSRTDVYALGCVTFEMLAGEPPFTGPTAQSIVAKVITAAATPRRS
jgi:serine/threonine protein kinase